MQRIYSLISILLIAALCGCELMSPSGPRYSAIVQPHPSADKALVYVYRTTNGRWVGRVHILVDGKLLAEIGDMEYSWCQLAPGKHVIRAEWGLMDKPMFEGGQFEPKTFDLTVAPEKTYQVCYSINDDGEKPGLVESSGLLGKVLSKSHVISVTLEGGEQEGLVGPLGSCNLREPNPSN